LVFAGVQIVDVVNI